MDQRLIDAAEAGNIDAVYALLRQNPSVLEEVDRVPFVNTPLHMAVSAGQARFVKEIANLKPSFARKLNEDGDSPIHLASTKGHLELVRELLKIGDDLCLLRGREKRTPLHSAAIAGNICVLDELLKSCPECLGELTVREETALHLAVKNNQFEAFKLLLECLKQNNKEDVVNWKDDEGNTVLHLAASIKQRQTIEDLLCSNSASGMIVVDVKAMNINNQTALDVLLQLPDEAEKREIGDILRRAGVAYANEIISTSPPSSGHTHVLANIPMCLSRSWATCLKLEEEKDSQNYVRNVMLVVAVLIATKTFLTGVIPPAGYWQHDYNPNHNNTTVTTTSQNSHTAGTPIALTQRPVEFAIFTIFNLLGIFISMCMILILTKRFPLRPLLLTAQLLMICTYASSLSNQYYNAQLLIIQSTIALRLVLFGALTFRFTAKFFWMVWNRHTG